MVSNVHQSALDRIREILQTQPDIQVAIAFGSVVTGEAGPNSDIDLAILSPQTLDASRRSELIRMVAEVTGRPVDLIDLRTAGVMTLRTVFRQGQRLICRDRRAHDQVLTRMITDAEDFLPYRQRILRERRNAWTR